MKNKVIFLGKSGVGKTSIISYRKYGTFNYNMDSTIGAAYVQINEQYDNHDVQLYIWDTAGQEQYSSVVPIYFRDANVAIIVGSFSDDSSIKELDKWNKFCEESNYQPTVIVVINKLDLATEETINSIKDEIREKFETFFFVSAKSGNGIDEFFSYIAQVMYEMSLEKYSENPCTTEIAKKESINQNQENGCC